jgi:hypothetical protein
MWQAVVGPLIALVLLTPFFVVIMLLVLIR